MSNSNADVVRDVLLNRFDTTTAEIAEMLDAKDRLIVELKTLMDECSRDLWNHELGNTVARRIDQALTRLSPGLPI